jgi:hypothetical protein
VNKLARERVAEWQTIDTLPDGHSIPVLEIGKRVLTGFVGSIEVPAEPSVISDTENLIKQAKELQNEEERLKSDFPAATKIMDPEDEASSTDNEGNGDGSESSGVIVEKEDSPTPKDEMLVQGPQKRSILSEDGTKECCKKIGSGDAHPKVDPVATATVQVST